MPTELIAAPGEQKTNNASTGTSESLRVSTSSTFGSSTSVSTTEGFKVSSKSTLKPIKATIIGEFGSNNGKMSVDVGNIRTEGPGSHTANSTASSFDINSEKSVVTEGFSNIDGVTSQVNLDIDPTDTVTEVDIDDVGGGDVTNMKTANGSANQILSNSLSVDISNSTFNSAFSQAF
tara:strand:- start:547 stop:1077 length:531 start_codon:yes stop_codon:yes gene_type:complete